MVLFDLASDMEFGFFLAYYRNFAIPSGARTLVANGEIPAHPMKRSIDTGVVIYELIAGGLDSDRGRQMTALLNRVHEHVPASGEDFLYVLLSLLIVPIRWTQNHGWRPPTQLEIAAATRFFGDLGARMHIPDFPPTFEAAAAFFDDYEQRRVGPSAAGRTLINATVQVLQGTQPRFLHPLTRRMIATMLDDDRINNALGLPCSRWWSRAALNTGLAARNAIHRRRPAGPSPRFTPGQPMGEIHPNGYVLANIGPEIVMEAGARTRPPDAELH
ncbi:oxygenase MpaB family protein [Arthrobacter sp. A5]|uniref:oxygenase MpaB family protein n=1 Tax=Arthrobacter sp. A5 TaxID=576926 RepID=UPI003DA81109